MKKKVCNISCGPFRMENADLRQKNWELVKQLQADTGWLKITF